MNFFQTRVLLEIFAISLFWKDNVFKTWTFCWTLPGRKEFPKGNSGTRKIVEIILRFLLGVKISLIYPYLCIRNQCTLKVKNIRVFFKNTMLLLDPLTDSRFSIWNKKMVCAERGAEWRLVRVALTLKTHLLQVNFEHVKWRSFAGYRIRLAS